MVVPYESLSTSLPAVWNKVPDLREDNNVNRRHYSMAKREGKKPVDFNLAGYI
jgi:hypothetical protein